MLLPAIAIICTRVQVHTAIITLTNFQPTYRMMYGSLYAYILNRIHKYVPRLRFTLFITRQNK